MRVRDPATTHGEGAQITGFSQRTIHRPSICDLGFGILALLWTVLALPELGMGWPIEFLCELAAGVIAGIAIPSCDQSTGSRPWRMFTTYEAKYFPDVVELELLWRR